MTSALKKQIIATLVAISITLVIWFIVPVPKGVQPNAWHLFALFVGTIAAIIGKAMPIGAISLISISLVAITQVTRPGNLEGAVNDALSGFSNSLIWLIVTSVMISIALSKYSLGKRIGFYFISLFGKKTLGIAYSLAISELVLAPVTPSNTARGGAIIHPIMRSIATAFKSDPEQGTEKKLGRYLALVNYNANPITSAMFITATAPNPLMVGLIAKGTGMTIQITWGQWALAALLPCLVMLLLMPLVLYFFYPPEIKETPDASRLAKEELKNLGRISLPEGITIGVLAMMLLMWAGVPSLLFGPSFAISATTTAFIGISSLLLTRVLTWEDVLKARTAWDTLVWFSALVMMASFLGSLGLTGWFANEIKTLVTQWGLGWVEAVTVLVLINFYTHYFFASTTAHISAMFAAFFAVGVALGAPPLLYGFILAFSSSLMMSLTHYGTGTAPIIYGSGYTSLNEWWGAGAIMSVVNLSVLVIVGLLWWRLLGFY